MQVTLTVISGPHQGREFSFEEHSSFIAGRSKKAQFRLPQKDEFFSRIHFLVELNPPLCRILDLGSRNGTLVNGRPIKTIELKAGDLIEAGETVIRVAIIRSPEEIAAETSSTLANHAHRSGPEAFSGDETLVPQHMRRANRGRGTPPEPVVAVVPTPTADPFADTDLRVPSPSVLSARDHLPADYRELVAQREQPIDGYLIVDELGRGGMGVVYRAICEADQSVVALKTVLPAATVTASEFEKFRREAMILGSLDHPHIVRFRDVGESCGMVYFSMDYVPGIDGQKLLRQHGGPLPVARAVGIVCQLLKALEHAHGLGFVHRDIKPSNRLVEQVDGKDFVRLTDFGLARTYQTSRFSGLTMTGEIGGTTPYMPPEQITAFRDSPPAVDQYASAATLYNLLTNAAVYDFPKEVRKQLLMILSEPTIPIDQRRGDLPAGLVHAIHRALAREPEDRFANVAAFRREIECYVKL